MLQRLIKDGAITVNALPTKASYEPGEGDVVEVLVPPPLPTNITPEDIPLDVIYEDQHMLAINKPTGIICHPSGPTQGGTLANGLAFYAETLSSCTDPFRPGIVHRLDKNTSGVMLVAKCDEAHWRISLQFERRTISKSYVAIVEGNPSRDGDIIDRPIMSVPNRKDRFTVASPGDRNVVVKQAVTRYQVAERFQGYTLVDLHPKTGRTHQLRVHMASIGHPIVGDTLYGGHLVSERDLTGSGSNDPLFTHQCLHARRIKLRHPIHETPLQIEAPLHPNIQALLDLLRTHRPRTRRS